ncbi:MAG: MmgE/PrpD family protein [Prevotella sp.]|nr:MmgE/PrpD family protein [Prevotella sp.]
MQNLTKTFIANLSSLLDADIPNGASETAHKCLLDYLGVSLAGASLLKEKERHLIGCDNEGHCPVIGHSHTASANTSALINGISAHVIELDDGHRIGMLHLGSPIISALLAVAEKEKLSSQDFIRGVVVGYEVAIRLACAVQPGSKLRGYHATGTCGTVGATMGIAAALHFDEEQMKSAFSAATTSAAGLLEMIEGDTELKPYNAGRAAMDGVTAAYIGKSCFKAPEDALGGKRGFLEVMTDEPKMEYLTDFCSDQLMIETIYMKPYAACRHCHPSIEAALDIRQQVGFDINDVESIHVDTYKLAVAGHDHTEIKGINSAKMSIPYSLAVALCTGKAGLDKFTDKFINDKNIQAITDKVTVTDVEDLTVLCPQKRVAEVTVKTKTGVFSKRVDFPKGEPESPLSQQELEAKFRGLAMYGGLTSEECDEVICEIWKKDFDIKKIISLCCSRK